MRRIIFLCALLCSNMFLMAQKHDFVQVAFDDCGETGKQPHLILGEDYTMPAYPNAGQAIRTCNFGSKVIYAFMHSIKWTFRPNIVWKLLSCPIRNA